MNKPMNQVFVVGMILSLCSVTGFAAEPSPNLDQLTGQPAELSAWAYAYRADLKVQEKPEANLILRRLQRIDQVYRPVSHLLATPDSKIGVPWPKQLADSQLLSKDLVAKRGELLPAPGGALQSALLWEGRMHLNRVELHWASKDAEPPQESVELRIYPSPYGWFGWQSDQTISTKPEISVDGLTWVYKGDWDEVDMVATFIKPADAGKGGVPQIRAYGPEVWKRMDVEIEWGFDAQTQSKDYDGHVEGFFGLVSNIAPLAGDSGTTGDATDGWKSNSKDATRRGISATVLYIQPEIEKVGELLRYPYGHPRDTRITVWTKSGNFTFLVRDLDNGPILAPEFGFFVTKAGSGKSARAFASELAASNTKSIREMTREHPEATWDQATHEITLPLLPHGTTMPAYKQVEDPPMEIQLPDKHWTDAWRMGVSQMKKGELTYMQLALEAPRPIHVMDVVGLHDTASTWLDGFLKRPGTPSDGDFSDGAGNFCTGKLFHGTTVNDYPGYETYELVHNGGTGRILYDLAEHYFLTGDAKWFKANQARMQAAAEWIMRQRDQYLADVPNRADLWAAGLQPPQHIADCAWGQSEWKWYVNIDAWYYQGLHRFGQAMAEIDPANAAKYLDESAQYRAALRKAIDRAITLSPVIRVRNGTYRSYIPPILYIRGPSIGQVIQISMTDNDWSLEMVDAANIPAMDDVRLDGHLDVCEDVMALNPVYIHGGTRYQYLIGKRKEAGLSSADDWFWGGFPPQLGYGYLANIDLRRDEIPSFLRQWINSYAAFVMAIPDYPFTEHFMNHTSPEILELIKKGENRLYYTANGHALSYFMEQFRSLLVWEDEKTLWLAKATPRDWLEQGKTISVKNAPSYFGVVSYQIVSDTDHGKITATVEIPSRNPPASVLLRFRHPKSLAIKSVTVNGAAWTDFDPAKEVIRLHDVSGTVKVEASY